MRGTIRTLRTKTTIVEEEEVAPTPSNAPSISPAPSTSRSTSRSSIPPIPHRYVANGRGGGFLPVSVKGDSANEVRDFCRAPTHKLVPDGAGRVPYRTDAVYIRSLPLMRNCLLEATTTAAGMGLGKLGVNRAKLNEYMDTWRVDSIHGPSMGVLDRVLCEAGSPFRLPVVDAHRKWTRLLNMTDGIYLALVLAEDDGKPIGHFIVYDAWRDLLFMGPKWGVLRVQPKDKETEAAARAYLFEHYQIKTPLRVCKLVVAANRVSETEFNFLVTVRERVRIFTPELQLCIHWHTPVYTGCSPTARRSSGSGLEQR